MKVLYVMGNTVYGGADVHLRKLLLYLKGKSVRPTVVCAYEGELSEWLQQHRIEVLIIPMTYWPMGPNEVARAVIQLARLIESQEFNLIHTHLMPAEICTSLASALTRCPPLLSTVHEITGYDAQSGLGSMLGTRYICVCQAVKQNLIAAGIEPEKISVIYNDVETDVFCPVEPAQASLEQFGFATSCDLMVTLARLSPEKNLDMLLHAAQAAATSNSRLRWLIIGEGPEEQNLKNLCRSLGLDHKVRFQPFYTRHRVPEILSTCVAHVLPSKQEGFPLVNLEAMACGKPTIVTDVGGNSEAVNHRKTGLVIPDNDVRALTQAMLTLASDHDFARQLGENGCKWVRQEFASPSMSEATWKLYQTYGQCAVTGETSAPNGVV